MPKEIPESGGFYVCGSLQQGVSGLDERSAPEKVLCSRANMKEFARSLLGYIGRPSDPLPFRSTLLAVSPSASVGPSKGE